MANKKINNSKRSPIPIFKNKNIASPRKVTDRTIRGGNKWPGQQLAKQMKSHRIPQWQEDETTQYKESDRQGGPGWHWFGAIGMSAQFSKLLFSVAHGIGFVVPEIRKAHVPCS